MTGNFVCSKNKRSLNLFLFFLLTLLSLGFQSTPAKAEIISYSAQLEGCGGIPYVRSTCSASLTDYLESGGGYNVTQASCTPDTLTIDQLVTCNISGIEWTGAPTSFTVNQWMYPFYACSYGGLGGPDFRLYRCDIQSTEIISTKNLGNQSTCDSIGNPIHPRTGNKSTTESDYNSAPFNFTRYYNNQQNKLDRNIGIQWRHSYSARLVLSSSATPPVTFAERPDGKTIFFRFIGGQWVGDGDISDKLIELPGSGWQVDTAGDTIETYNTSGKLLSITNRDGRTQTLIYDTNGRLSTVTDDNRSSIRTAVWRCLTCTCLSASKIASMMPVKGARGYVNFSQTAVHF